jgi:hypothetical protein
MSMNHIAYISMQAFLLLDIKSLTVSVAGIETVTENIGTVVFVAISFLFRPYSKLSTSGYRLLDPAKSIK